MFKEGVKDLYFGTVDASTANWRGSTRESGARWDMLILSIALNVSQE